jgi:hypothetical protein
MGCNDLIAECDSSETIEACMGEQNWWNDSSIIFADILDLANTIDKVSLIYCPREANKVAHELAKFRYSNNQSCNRVN